MPFFACLEDANIITKADSLSVPLRPALGHLHSSYRQSRRVFDDNHKALSADTDKTVEGAGRNICREIVPDTLEYREKEIAEIREKVAAIRAKRAKRDESAATATATAAEPESSESDSDQSGADKRSI